MEIIGYRKLSEEELQLINEGKELAVLVGRYCERLRQFRDIPRQSVRAVDSVDPGWTVIDQRWASIGVTHLQEGFMALTRAIAKPETF